MDVIKKLNCHVSTHQAYRAKRLALDQIQGTCDEQFSKLWEYSEELRRSNPGSTVILGTELDEDGNSRFNRMYVCFKGIKDGFLSGCRPIIGVDGCHLKGPHKGVLLTAVGVDPNNALYPIAYALVSSENSETWEWFLHVLKADLSIIKENEYTFISDRQKGLINAFRSVFPASENRFCVRHLHNNFKNAGFIGLALKNAMWKAAQATRVSQFHQRMQELRELNEQAADWFNDKPPSQWTKSHFSEFCKCDMLLNNGCESFNSCILDAREQPVITMFEWIREYLLKRFQENRDKAIKRWKSRVCPRIKKIVEKHAEWASDCIPIKCSDRYYQVSSFDGTQFCIDLIERTCSCRSWGLSGIPCKHAISAIYNQDEDPEDYVHECYTVEVYNSVYQHVIFGINGEELWEKNNFIPPLPPNFGRGVGRPCKARRREADEPTTHKKKSTSKAAVRLRRKQKTIKCRKCGIEGHNSATCDRQPKNVTHSDSEMHNDSAETSIHLNRKKLKVWRKTPQPNIQSSSSITNTGMTMEYHNNVVCETNGGILPGSVHISASKRTTLPPIHKEVLIEDFITDTPTQQSGVQEVMRLSKVAGPSMLEQCHMSRSLIPVASRTITKSVLSASIQFRAPPPMDLQPLPTRNIQDVAFATVMVEGGQKYIKLSTINCKEKEPNMK